MRSEQHVDIRDTCRTPDVRPQKFRVPLLGWGTGYLEKVPLAYEYLLEFFYGLSRVHLCHVCLILSPQNHCRLAGPSDPFGVPKKPLFLWRKYEAFRVPKKVYPKFCNTRGRSCFRIDEFCTSLGYPKNVPKMADFGAQK